MFETIQQGEKLIKSNNITNLKVYNILVNKMKEEGLSNYIGFVTRLIVNEYEDLEYFFKEDIDDIIKNIKYIRDKKINIDTFLDKSISSLNSFLYDYNRKLIINNFLNKYLPANLRVGISDISKENINNLYKFIHIIENLSSTDKELIKKGSRFKTINEWVKYCIEIVFDDSRIDIEELLKSNIKIHEQDSEWLFYTPLDYDSYMIVKYKNWCTMVKSFFDFYLKKGFVIALNKKDVKKSLFGYKNGDNFDIFDYNNRMYYLSTWKEIKENNDIELINKIKKYLNPTI